MQCILEEFVLKTGKIISAKGGGGFGVVVDGTTKGSYGRRNNTYIEEADRSRSSLSAYNGQTEHVGCLAEQERTKTSETLGVNFCTVTSQPQKDLTGMGRIIIIDNTINNKKPSKLQNRHIIIPNKVAYRRQK